MNAALRINIWIMGDDASGETNSGRNARKNMDNFGLRILIKNPFTTICHRVLVDSGELTCSDPVSRHMDQDRYMR